MGHSGRIRVIRRRQSRSQHSPIISTGISHPSSAGAIRPAAVILTRPMSAASPPVLRWPGPANSTAAPRQPAARQAVAGQAGGFLPGVPLACFGMRGTRTGFNAPALIGTYSGARAGAAWGAYSITLRGKPTPGAAGCPWGGPVRAVTRQAPALSYCTAMAAAVQQTRHITAAISGVIFQVHPNETTQP